MMARKVGRPKVLSDKSRGIYLELDKPHRDYITEYAEIFQQNHGVLLSRSAALRKIIEEHKAFTDSALSETEKQAA